MERKSRKVIIHDIRIKEICLPRIRMEVDCSKGTYIRTLCHDIGESIRTGGCMESLLRTRTAKKVFTKEYGEDAVKSTQDVDHIIDLQLGGKDIISNMSPLDKSVNRSLGSQIAYVIKELNVGTILKNFTIS